MKVAADVAGHYYPPVPGTRAALLGSRQFNSSCRGYFFRFFFTQGVSSHYEIGSADFSSISGCDSSQRFLGQYAAANGQVTDTCVGGDCMRKVCFLTVLLVVATTASFAAPFVGTGSGLGSNCGMAQQLDPRYSLIQVPPGGGTPPFAYTTAPNPAWVTPPPSNCWINPTGDANQDLPPGFYDYQITFDWGTGNLSASFAADNNAEIWLNGVNTGIGTSGGVNGFDHLTPFTLTTADGLKDNTTNYIDFVVYNWQDFPISTGLLVTDAVPEPGSLVMFGSGLLGAIGLFRRKLNL